MENYLSQLNQMAEQVISTNGQHLDSLYAKIIQGKELGYDFVKVEPSINHLNQDNISIENKLLFEHYAYLVKVKNESGENAMHFFMNIEDDVKRTLRLIYRQENKEEYFGTVENAKSIYYIFTDSVIDFLIEKATNHHIQSLWYHQKISAKNFIKAWVEHFTENQIDPKTYNSNKDYSNYILGSGCGDIDSEKYSPLIRDIVKSLDPSLKIYREDKFSDVSFYSSHKFENVSSLHYKKHEREDVFTKTKYHWSSQCMISLEHENDYRICYEEMMYLTTRRARLKVLVTYYDDDTIDFTRTVLEALCENFSTIIRQSNMIFNENDRTEYLLIVGSKLKKNLPDKEDKFLWNMRAFNWSGQWTEKYSQL